MIFRNKKEYSVLVKVKVYRVKMQRIVSVIKSISYVTIMSWIHMTSHVMDLTWLGQFHIIISRGWLSHPSPDLPNLSNQPLESTF